MSREIDLYIAHSDEVPLKSFVVAKLRKVYDTVEKYGPEDIQELFHGEMTHADALFGYGIILMLKKQKQKAMIIFNSDETDYPKEFCGR